MKQHYYKSIQHEHSEIQQIQNRVSYFRKGQTKRHQ